VPDDEKWRRFRLIEELQERIAGEINKDYLDKEVEVLFEGKNKERWRGRTPTNKLVFTESDQELLGKILPVKITWAGPWSMQAKINPK
jgi:tRNA-2-methylthio-N6-dimethylallyladenosine synthase